MSDLIDRQQAIDAVDDYIGTFDAIDVNFLDGLKTAKKLMMQLPSAQPERKRGEWIPDNNCYYETRYICSECKLPFRVETFMMKPSWWFCPNCGADMRGESDE